MVLSASPRIRGRMKTALLGSGVVQRPNAQSLRTTPRRICRTKSPRTSYKYELVVELKY